MAFHVFLSHSVSPRELAFVYAVSKEAFSMGAMTLIPDRKWYPNRQVPGRISQQIKKADYVLVIATAKGNQVKWVNKEFNYAVKINKPLLIVVDKEIKLVTTQRVITIDHDNPAKTIKEISAKIEKFKTTKENKEFLTWIGIGGLLLLLLWPKKE